MATNPLGQALSVFDWTTYFQNLLNNTGMNAEGEPEKPDPNNKNQNQNQNQNQKPESPAKDPSTENLSQILDFARGTKTGFESRENSGAMAFNRDAEESAAWERMWDARKNEANNPVFDPAAHAATRQLQQFAGVARPVGRVLPQTDLPPQTTEWRPSSMPGGGIESMIDPRAENRFDDSNFAQIFQPETPNQLFGPRIIDNGVGVNPDGTPWRDPGLISNGVPFQESQNNPVVNTSTPEVPVVSTGTSTTPLPVVQPANTNNANVDLMQAITNMFTSGFENSRRTSF